jgi:hypothetical protein
MILVSAENAFGGDDSSMEASLMGSSSSKCDACIAFFFAYNPLLHPTHLRNPSLLDPRRSSIRALTITNTQQNKTKGAAKAKQWTKFSHSTPTEYKATTKKMKNRKRRDAAAEHETTPLQLCLLAPSNSETKNGPLVGRENT